MRGVQSCKSTPHLAVYLPSLRGGGAERVMVTLANGFAARGHTVDLVLASAEGPYLKDVCPSVRIMDLRARRVSTSLPALVRYLRKERPAALLSAMGHANVIAVLACKLACVPTRIVVSERANYSICRINETSMRGRIMGSFMRWTYPRADAVVAVSAGVADDLASAIAFPREKISVIYNPVVAEPLLEKAQLAPDHLWLQAGQPPVILGVGRLTVQKDFHTLIVAFGRLRQTRDVRLIILGEGELRPQLEALAVALRVQDAVSLPGFVDNPFAYMSRSALFVLSSAWEGLPNALVQAMACGTPVVATDCPSGPAEILENGRWGRLVPVGNEVALAEAMAATLDEQEHPDVAARSAEFGVALAVDGYLKVMLPRYGTSA